MKLDLTNILVKISKKDREQASNAKKVLESKTGLGNDYLGWLDYASKLDNNYVNEIYDYACNLHNKVDILVVCGIGGSYLGSKAVIDAINGLDFTHQVIYLGNTFSANYTKKVLDYLQDKRFAVNVISKSGTTTETAIAFRLLKQLLISQHKDQYNQYIVATTDAKSGALRKMCEAENYKSYVLPSNIGGRYSVITPVGLLPIAFACKEKLFPFIEGIRKAEVDLMKDNDIATEYATCRYRLAKKYQVEALVSYEPQFLGLADWYKQLFGESEGKEHQGLYPTKLIYSTDLHSLGQFVQEGSPILFETLIKIKETNEDIEILEDNDNYDGLNYLAGEKLSWVNEQALTGTLIAHTQEGNVPNIIIELDRLDPYNVGYFIYFMMKSCGVSAYLLGVNPFNQPGVEIYKKQMFRLLGKE